MKTLFLIGLFLTASAQAEIPAAQMRDIDDLCEKFETAYSNARTIAREKKIAKLSGALNASASNGAARTMVRVAGEMNALIASYEKQFKVEFDGDMCVFIQEASKEEIDEALSVINPSKVGKNK